MVDHDMAAVFDLMDKWRHLPSYQLERRADIFFAHFLPDILEGTRNLRIHPVIVPEFPVHKGTIKPKITNNTSNNIDYVVFSEDLSEAYLIELKTDDKSRDPEEDKDLMAAMGVGFEALLFGLVKIIYTTKAKRKYYQLINMLANLGFYSIPGELHELFASNNLRGIAKCIELISVQNAPRITKALYIQPNGSDPSIINFAKVASVLEESRSPVARRFAVSLRSWSETEAGNVTGV
jgi:hypothetical protein